MLNYGVFTRRVAMMPLMKVTDMSYNRSVLGRLVGYGEFVLESAGQEQALRTVELSAASGRALRGDLHGDLRHECPTTSVAAAPAVGRLGKHAADDHRAGSRVG